jgi:hypothetical protein
MRVFRAATCRRGFPRVCFKGVANTAAPLSPLFALANLRRAVLGKILRRNAIGAVDRAD